MKVGSEIGGKTTVWSEIGGKTTVWSEIGGKTKFWSRIGGKTTVWSARVKVEIWRPAQTFTASALFSVDSCSKERTLADGQALRFQTQIVAFLVAGATAVRSWEERRGIKRFNLLLTIANTISLT